MAESKNNMKYIKKFESFKIFENIEEAEINTDDDELNGIYCVDFTPSELKKDEIIYNILVDVDEYEHRWAKNTDEVEVYGMASKSTPSKYKVISNDGKEVKIEEIK